ncbi:MAG: N-6 DNA methylase [Theionarchaea archaeon]|nr:N-6 DNA methylase [Theionarchaea archaeon]
MTIDVDTITLDFKKLEMYSEEEFKIHAVHIIEAIASSLKLSVETNTFSIVSSVRESALFDRVLIQYSVPGSLLADSWFSTAQTEMIDSITLEGNNHSTFGILLSDGIAFMRFNGRWIVSGPYEINRSTILRVICAMRGLKKKKFCEQELIKDFGPQSDLAIKTIMTLYDNLDTTNPEVSSLFAQWMETFLHMSGSRKENLDGLDTFYSPGKDCTRLLFCIHTYYAILIKTIAAITMHRYSSPTIEWGSELNGSGESEEFTEYMKNLDEKTLFDPQDHSNKYFTWYLNKIYDFPIFKEIAQKLSDYEFSAAVLIPEETPDILKTLYQSLVPPPIRHNLGEYYTPDWLAQLLLDRIGYTKDAFERMAEISHDLDTPLKLRLLDPACGSGTFLVEALKRLRAYAEEHDLTEHLTDYIVNIAGIDCNPLAVLTCKINYLLCMGDLLSLHDRSEFPVYCADSLTARSNQLFPDKADYVIGNPPWILWDNLPAHYRTMTQPLWKDYNLFTLTASQARHGGGKKDISILFTSVCIDKYLKDSGIFGFVITQSVFKTKGAGEGFRQFKVKDTSLKVVEVHDFVKVNPFEGAYTKAAAIILKKGEKTEYPVTYLVWGGDQSKRLPLNVTEMAAFPSDPANELSPWVTVPFEAVQIVKKVYGRNSYPVYEGINSGGANGVFWIKIGDTDQIDQKTPSTIEIENVTDGMKKKVKKIKTTIEDFFVYPLIKSRHVGKWKMKGYGYTLQMQDPVKRVGLNEKWVKEHFPKTYGYLKEFNSILLHRKAYIKFMKSRNVPFYTMYNVGIYTYAPYKVVWNRMGSSISACVISTVHDPYLGEKIVLPENVLAFIPTETEDEAHYICSIMNSSITDMILRAIAGGTKSFGTPRIVRDTIKIPLYEKDNELHKTLSTLSRKAHTIAQKNIDTRDIEGEIDRLVAVLYNLSEEELSIVKETLRAGTKNPKA